MPQLVAIAGRNEEAVAEAARRYGFAEHVTDWRALVADDARPAVRQLGPEQPARRADDRRRRGRQARDLREAARAATPPSRYETWQRVEATGVKHMCAFNYRFVPAVRLAREMIESGELGEIHALPRRLPAGVGLDRRRRLALRQGDRRLGRARRPRRARDRPRALPGRRDRVGGGDDARRSCRAARSTTRSSRPCAFESGAVGTIEASRFATGRKNAFTWEINGSKGSIAFDLERLNELQVHFAGSTPGGAAQGFRTVLVSEADHPFWEHWWPQGHIIGWEHTFVHELHHLLTAIRDDGDVAPHGATLEDGYRAAEVCDAMLRSAEQGGARDRHLPQLSRTVLLDRHARHQGRRVRLPARAAARRGRRRAGRRRRHARAAARPSRTSRASEVAAAAGVDVDALRARGRPRRGGRRDGRAPRRRWRGGCTTRAGSTACSRAGGSGNTAIATAAMRALPVGVPEADGLDDGRRRHARLRRRRATSTMMASVTDVAGHQLDLGADPRQRRGGDGGHGAARRRSS